MPQKTHARALFGLRQFSALAVSLSLSVALRLEHTMRLRLAPCDLSKIDGTVTYVGF